MRTVRVKWEGPLSLDEVKDLDDEDEDCGLYQIYGRHIGQHLEVVNLGNYGNLCKKYRSRDRKRWGWSGDYG